MNEKHLFPLALYLANDSRERERRAIARERSAIRADGPSARQLVGQSVVRFGKRLSGEPNLKPVRSR
jgi:hypothetical protein